MLSVIPRKWCRVLLTLIVCLNAAILLHLLIFPAKSLRFWKKKPTGGNLPEGFIAIGRSSRYPDEWEKGARDPFYNLIMAGDDNSPGQYGVAVVLEGSDIELSQSRFKENNYDVVVSDKIPMDRILNDIRHPDCLNIKYDEDLPSVSVIIIFHNEAPSVILRTVVSVLNRSPRSCLKEIILVDDHSDDPALNDTFPRAVEALFPPLVKLIRNPKRLGLIKARLAGADKAQGEVLLFLDAHCEVLKGWLEPLLQRVKEDYRNIPMPEHGNILKNGFDLSAAVTLDFHGTFDWGLAFRWQKVPEKQMKQIKSKAEPVKSPTMAGGLFAISRKWWEHLGKYDPGFEIWGGENLELSFKAWMCGGKLELLPCSHVGHVFRDSHQKSDQISNFMAINQKRLAEVWLDKYIDIVYMKNPSLKELDAGDVSERKALRERLKCKSFDWYMKVYHPDKHIPTLVVKASHGLLSSNNQCADTMQKESGPLKLYPTCHYTNSQDFQFTAAGEIRANVDLCLRVNILEVTTSLVYCSGDSSEKWIHSGQNQPIKPLLNANFCLSYSNDDVILVECDTGDAKQLWSFKEYISR